MTNALLPTLLGAVLAPLLLGAGVAQKLGLSPRAGWRLFIAWSLLLGQFVLAPATFGWLATGRPFPGWLLPAVGALAGLALLATGRARSAIAPPERRGDPWVRTATLLLVAVVMERATLAAASPILGGDEAYIWSGKARLLYAGGDLGAWFAALFVQHGDYPMLNPMMQALAFASSGEALLWENRLPLQAASTALLLLLSAAVERLAPRWLTITVLVAFTSTCFVVYAPTVYSDVLLAFALLATIDAWSRCGPTGEFAWWRLGCFGLAAMLATKNEGLMLGVAVIAAAPVARLVARAPALPQLRWQLMWLLVPLATVVAGQWFNSCHGLAGDMTGPSGHGMTMVDRLVHWFPERIGPVLAHYARLLLDGSTARWLVLAMLLAPLAAGRALLRPERIWPWLVVALSLAGYVLVFVSTPANMGEPDGAARGLVWHLNTAADRTVLHVLPTAALALCALLGAAWRDGARQPLRQPIG